VGRPGGDGNGLPLHSASNFRPPTTHVNAMAATNEKPPRQLRHRADRIRGTLNAAYADVNTPLRHRNAFELLVATILSAQCTDRQVNGVTVALFERFPTPAAMAGAPLEQIEALIRPTGFFRSKARHLQGCARQLQEVHGGEVPHSLEHLTRLPGVGRKTANVVLGAAFDIPGIVVDTHVARVSRRLGLTTHQDPVKIEPDLMALVPRREWSDFCLRLIFFGREICHARRPACPRCPIRRWCPFPEKTPG
jgi:endonuclease-3